MKKTLLVLDAITNGHDAASEFMRRQGWSQAGCNIVFCGTHARLIDQLKEGPSYAVLPVFNSTAGVGEVPSVVPPLKVAAEMGYDFVEVDRFDLQINHCLLVPQGVTRAEELDQVMSQETAIAQCGKFLDSVGITPDKRSRRDSTGNAAKVVARLGPNAKVGAIAPMAAAEEYGLKVLARGIQDDPNNKTTFVLLENKAEIRPLTVGVIGNLGGMGQLCAGLFTSVGCRVIGSDIKGGEMTNVDVVIQSDVVIFSIDVPETPSVIRSILPFTRPDQLLMDVTSVKGPALKAMLESSSQVVGLHPMFAPDTSFDGQTVVVCPERLEVRRWKTWVVNVLGATGARIKWSTESVHDDYMMVVQSVPHTLSLAQALLLAETGASARESLDFTSPFYRISFSTMGRMLSQYWRLYASIAMENPKTAPALDRLIAILTELARVIRAKDYAAYEQKFMKAREHFGEEVVREGSELFVQLISVVKTLYGKNSVMLEFTTANDQPGLLKKVSEVFARRDINLVIVHAMNLRRKGVLVTRFAMSFDQPRTSDNVRRALEEIEGWVESKAEVI